MKLKTGQKVHYDSGPNMTPMVDIVMVILIFFMLGASFIGAEHFLRSQMLIDKEGISSDSKPKNDIKVPETLKIRVAPDGDTFIAQVNTVQFRGAGDLTAYLRQKAGELRQANKLSEYQISICPQPETRYEHLVLVFQAANMAEFEKVGFGR